MRIPCIFLAMQLAIKVDVDTRIGLREGVPRLLELLRRYGVKASFFVSFGADVTETIAETLDEHRRD
jgi:hypothetical protein